MRSCLLALLVVPLLGCKVTRFQQQLPNGHIIRASDIRLFTVTTATIEATISSNGLIVIKVQASSRGDAKMLEAVAEGAAKGAVQGLK